jgi:hypothetical protein
VDEAPRWRLWITKRVGLDGEAFDVWNYAAEIGDFYSARIWGYADDPGTEPNEEDPRWSWEIHQGSAGDDLYPIVEGEAASRTAARSDCERALLQYVLLLFKDTGDLLREELPDPEAEAAVVDADDLDEDDEAGWQLSLEASIEGDDSRSWYYGVFHGDFHLTLELAADSSQQKPSELGAWRWWITDEVETLCEGKAPSRASARQQCVGALLDHFTDLASVVEELCEQELPASECTDRERPYVYEHEEERLDPNWVPEPPEHPATTEILRSVEAGASVDTVLASVREVCAGLSIEDLHNAIEVHRARCHTTKCPVLAALEAFLSASESVAQPAEDDQTP